MATGGDDGKARVRGERSIRIKLESTDFHTKLARDSKREKEEEIPRIISPQLIWPEKERSGGILEGGGAGLRRYRQLVAGGGRRLTGGSHLSAADREKRDGAWTGPTRAERT